MHIDVFNGDADGICALLQWRLNEPAEATLITGVKRDNVLLNRVASDIGAGADLLVLDINFELNRPDVERLLAAGARIRFFDHHYAGERISHPRLTLTIDEAPEVCTSLLVDRFLGGRQRAWAIAGAFGDNLPHVAADLAAKAGLREAETEALRRLGELLNYNSYGNALADLHFDPALLYRRLYACADPLIFVAQAPEFRHLAAGYASDIGNADALNPVQASPHAVVYVLPDQAWSRRVIGVWANRLSRRAPHAAHLVFCPDGAGRYTASVRSARERPYGAAAFCRLFPEGGGREAAGGINHLPESEVGRVTDTFLARFSLG